MLAEKENTGDESTTMDLSRMKNINNNTNYGLNYLLPYLEGDLKSSPILR